MRNGDGYHFERTEPTFTLPRQQLHHGIIKQGINSNHKNIKTL